MPRRVALLRAINVGGTGALRMERLRALAEGLGWKNVETHGASGNVLYTAGRAGAATDAARLAEALGRELGKPATVVVRSLDDLESLVRADPFRRADPRVPPKWRFVGFLAEASDGSLPPVPEGAPLAYAGRLPREVCWTAAAADRRAIDLPKRVEKTLGTAMTVRNWNVVNALAERLRG